MDNAMSGPQVRARQLDDNKQQSLQSTQQSSEIIRTNTTANANSNNGLLVSNQSFYNNSLAIRQEIHRFESVHPSIYAIYDLLELITDPLLAQQIREHVVCIEGMS